MDSLTRGCGEALIAVAHRFDVIEGRPMRVLCWCREPTDNICLMGHTDACNRAYGSVIAFLAAVQRESGVTRNRIQ